MSSESALSFLALLFSYFLKSAAAYLCLWMLSRRIRNSQVRFVLYALFLGGLVASWCWLFVSPYLASLPMRGVSIAHIASAKRFSWTLSAALVGSVARIIPGTLSIYVMVLALLLLRYCAHFWRVRKLLRDSRQAAEELSELFEVVRSGIGAVRCELRLINELRSPATTGWWHPKVLLPCELVPRLGRERLTQILRHELMHVVRRDYLWDRLSTLGCYLTFFHPLAWLARRRLRWERELVCDEGVAQRSRESRLEYASCLTTLASWWFLQDEATGHVDFFSSPPSLLAARVRALLVQPPAYSSCKKIGLTLMTAIGSGVSMLLVPEIAISLYQPAPTAFAPSQAVHRLQPTATRIGRGRVPQRRKHEEFMVPAPSVELRPTLPDLNFPVSLPVLASPASDHGDSDAADASDAAVASRNSSKGSQTIWDESIPQPSRRPVSKIGAAALRVLRLGIGVAATRIGGHEHEKEP